MKALDQEAWIGELCARGDALSHEHSSTATKTRITFTYNMEKSYLDLSRDVMLRFFQDSFKSLQRSLHETSCNDLGKDPPKLVKKICEDL